MPKFLPALGSAAVIVVVAALALSFYVNRQGGIGALPSASPSASPTVAASPSVEPTVPSPAPSNATPPGPRLPLLARGVFVTAGSDVTLAAIAEGSSVTGRMFVLGALDVDLQCTRTTEDGLIMIGGQGVTSSGYTYGSLAAIVLKRGSPVQATIWSQGDGPTSQAADCLAYLDEQLMRDRSTGGVRLEPIEGFVELGGSGSGGANATPLPGAALLARGAFVNGDDAVQLEATGEGTSVTGRMTVSELGTDSAFTVDLQCARTTEDGLIMIGGYTTEESVVSPVGTLAAIVLKRGSPVEATVWSQRGGPTSQASTCLAYLDEQLIWERSTNLDGDWTAPVGGTVELGP